MLPETRFLIQYLRTLQVGDIADFATMSEKAGVSVVDKRYVLVSALNTLERDHQMFFESVSKIGYRAIAPEDVPEKSTTRMLSRVRAATGRTRRKIENSGQSTTLKGLQGLAHCNLLDLSSDVEARQAIAKMKPQQAIDLNARQNEKRKILQELLQVQ